MYLLIQDNLTDYNSMLGVSASNLISVYIPVIAMQGATVDSIFKSYRILVVEANPAQRDRIKAALQQEGYDVVAIADGQQAVKILQSHQNLEQRISFDLMILDRTLPDVSGLDICRALRQVGNPIPILMTSENAGEHEKVVGLEVGADDYLAKPMSDRILIARCRALLRRSQGLRQPSIVPTVLKFKDLALYVEECRATLRNQELQLSPKEFALLRELMQSRGRVLSRENLLERVWGDDYFGNSKTLEVHIRWLRQKLEVDPSSPEYIVTLRGSGYRLG